MHRPMLPDSGGLIRKLITRGGVNADGGYSPVKAALSLWVCLIPLYEWGEWDEVWICDVVVEINVPFGEHAD